MINNLRLTKSNISNARQSGRAILGGLLPGGRPPDVRTLLGGRQPDGRRVRIPRGSPRAMDAIGRRLTSAPRKPDGVRLPE